MGNVFAPIAQPVVKREVEESQPEGKVDLAYPIDSKVLPPLDSYEAVKGYPYSAVYFGFDDIWKDLKSRPEIDVNKYMTKTDYVDNFVKRLITVNRYKNTTDSYNEIVNKIKSLLMIGDNEETDSQLDKVYTYSKMFMKKLDDDEKLKEMKKIFRVKE